MKHQRIEIERDSRVVRSAALRVRRQDCFTQYINEPVLLRGKKTRLVGTEIDALPNVSTVLG